MSIRSRARPGSRIAKVEIHEFGYSVDGLGIDDSGNRCVDEGRAAASSWPSPW